MATTAATEPFPKFAAGVLAYARAAQATLTPAQASVLLHERLCQELLAAKAAYQARRLDRMCRHTEKCMRVLLTLQNDLTPRLGEPGVRTLSGFYLHLYDRVRTILRQKDVEAGFDSIIELLRSFCSKMRAGSSAR